jgi:hypothetical protein
MEASSQSSSKSLKRKPSPLNADLTEQKMPKTDIQEKENGDLSGVIGDVLEKDGENSPGKIPESSEIIEKSQVIEEKNDENRQEKVEITEKVEVEEVKPEEKKEDQIVQKEDDKIIENEDKSTSVEDKPDKDEPLQT